MLAPQVHRANSDKQPTSFIWLARVADKRPQIICLGKESRFGGRRCGMSFGSWTCTTYASSWLFRSWSMAETFTTPTRWAKQASNTSVWDARKRKLFPLNLSSCNYPEDTRPGNE